MDPILASAGDDELFGTEGGDVFDMAGGGNDKVSAGAGNDTIQGGADWNSLDTVEGGEGVDRIVTSNAYYRISDVNFRDVEIVELTSQSAGQTLMRVWDTAAQSGERVTIDARGLGSGGWLRLEAQYETDADLRVRDSAGDDMLATGAGDDEFHLGMGGTDVADGGEGDDRFYVYGSLDAADSMIGGTGYDVAVLKGDYSAGLGVDSKTLNDIERVELAKGGDYRLYFTDDFLDGYDYAFVGVASEKGAIGQGRVVIDVSAETTASYTLGGSANDDALIGGGGRDTLEARGGGDSLHGGAGDDVIRLDGKTTGDDTIDGGDGWDVLDLRGLTRGVSIDFTDGSYGKPGSGGAFANVEFVFGTELADKAKGGALAETLYLYGGDDAASMGAGADYVEGGAGDDALKGGDDGDTLYGESGADRLLGQAGFDYLRGGSGDDRLDGGADGDTLTGDEGDDLLAGGSGDDQLWGESEADTLKGGEGDDFLYGGTGFDKLVGGAGSDTFYFEADDGKDLIVDFETGVDRLNFEAFEDLSFKQIKSHLTQRGDDVLVRAGDDLVTLQDVKLSQLGAADFEWPQVV